MKADPSLQKQLADLDQEVAETAEGNGLLGAGDVFAQVVRRDLEALAFESWGCADQAQVRQSLRAAEAQRDRAQSDRDTLAQMAVFRAPWAHVAGVLGSLAVFTVGIVIALPLGRPREIAVGLGLVASGLVAVALCWGPGFAHWTRKRRACRALGRAEAACAELQGEVAARLDQDDWRQRWLAVYQPRYDALHEFHYTLGELAAVPPEAASPSLSQPGSRAA